MDLLNSGGYVEIYGNFFHMTEKIFSNLEKNGHFSEFSLNS